MQTIVTSEMGHQDSRLEGQRQPGGAPVVRKNWPKSLVFGGENSQI